ncbi:hypothetical protein [Oceanobacillus massiliensis]|nr:hypothetical protein [Oceanobacillus massiliensis]
MLNRQIQIILLFAAPAAKDCPKATGKYKQVVPRSSEGRTNFRTTNIS